MRKFKLSVLTICLSSLIPGLIFTANLRAVSPTASPSAQPTSADEKVQEIRDMVKEKVDEIKKKIEKKAYVGTIAQITDQALTLDNFRGRERVRITEESTIIGTSKKEIKANELAVEDRIIAMGEIGENEILEASRIVVVPKLATPPEKRTVFLGTITQVDAKKSQISLISLKNPDETITLGVNSKADIIRQEDKKTLAFKNLAEELKVIAIFTEVAEDKTPSAKALYLLP
jgi:hypothetical protein